MIRRWRKKKRWKKREIGICEREIVKVLDEGRRGRGGEGGIRERRMRGMKGE